MQVGISALLRTAARDYGAANDGADGKALPPRRSAPWPPLQRMKPASTCSPWLSSAINSNDGYPTANSPDWLAGSDPQLTAGLHDCSPES